MPNNPLAVVEVVADQPLKLGNGPVRLNGTWQVSSDPEGWRYQLHGAEVMPGAVAPCRAGGEPAVLPASVPAMAQGRRHGRRLAQPRRQSDPGKLRTRPVLLDVATPCGNGGMSTICLCIVGDGRHQRFRAAALRPSRDPKPGELYDRSRIQFAKLHELVSTQSMAIIRTAADLRAARSSRPSVIVTSEGADWLDGKIERLDEAYQRWQLRQLQLTHYRPNELGDIQTDPACMAG